MDRQLLRKLFKTASIWESLRELHRNQHESIQAILKHLQDQNSEGDNNIETNIKLVLAELERIGKDISQGLVKESGNLLERVCTIFFFSSVFFLF